MSQICCRSRATCVAVCQAGLDYVHNTFPFVRDGKSMPLAEAMAQIKTSFPGAVTIRGTGTTSPNLTVPHK